VFRVDNADFIADKLASELLPYQEFREAFKNAEEAVARRLAVDGKSEGGRVELDVDWPFRERNGDLYISCADNGDGMTRTELERYMTTLAVIGAGRNQSLRGNQGMGLKISGPTRHKRGVLIRSLKNGERWMVQVGWNGHEYGLIPLGDDGELIVPVPAEMFPDFVNENGSGTVVTFLGSKESENTFWPQDNRARGWLFKYLHGRFFRLSYNGIDVLVRVPSGSIEDWPLSYAEAVERERKKSQQKGKPPFRMSGVHGTATIWDAAADQQGDGYRGHVPLAGNLANVPAAKLHWWVLPASGADVSSRTMSGGSIAVLFQNELHDWRTGAQANPYFGRLGILYGKSRIGFILEPEEESVTSDFARAHVLVDGLPVFQSDAWLVWADQFRSDIPEVIRRTIAEEQERIQAEDPERARRIKERLKETMALLRPKRYRTNPAGTTRAAGPTVTGADSGDGSVIERRVGVSTRQGAGGSRGIGSLLTQVDDTADQPANEVFSILQLEPQWVAEKEAEDMPIVNGNGRGLQDRAAALAGPDGATAPNLLLNREFRGYQTIVAAVNEWANPEGDDEKAALIEGFTQEWIEQKMVEAVVGLRQLENGSTWTGTNYDDAFSPVALTAAFMADRYHTLREVKRQAGAIRRQPVVTGS
jgi:hypothetical protein